MEPEMCARCEKFPEMETQIKVEYIERKRVVLVGCLIWCRKCGGVIWEESKNENLNFVKGRALLHWKLNFE